MATKKVTGKKRAPRKKGSTSTKSESKSRKRPPRKKAAKGKRPPWISIFYGPPGVGKTSLLANLPGVGFIIDPKETGIHDLVAWDQCPEPKVVKEATKWKRLLDLIDDASSWGIETLCLDSLTGFQQLCFSYHCHEYFNDDWSAKGFYAFQSGPKNAATRDWPDLLDALTDLNRTGVNIALIGHSQVKSQANPEGADYIAYEPTLDSKLWDITHAWAQGVLFMNYRIVLDEKRGQKTKANLEDSEGRLMYCQHSPAALAKNRFGLPSILELGESQEDAVETFTKAMSR